MEEIDNGSGANLFDQIDDLLHFPNDNDDHHTGVFDSRVVGCTRFPDVWSDDSALELFVPYEDIVQLDWLPTFVEDTFSAGRSTLSPVSILESSSNNNIVSGGKSKTDTPLSVAVVSHEKRARSKRPRPATFSPRPSIHHIIAPCQPAPVKKIRILPPSGSLNATVQKQKNPNANANANANAASPATAQKQNLNANVNAASPAVARKQVQSANANAASPAVARKQVQSANANAASPAVARKQVQNANVNAASPAVARKLNLNANANAASPATVKKQNLNANANAVSPAVARKQDQNANANAASPATVKKQDQNANAETESSPAIVRKCKHCQITKTPQWRSGPMGPKTLCNACGVRFKSGRLYPEYRPAASPTFVPSLHSNSHRKVLEMRNFS